MAVEFGEMGGKERAGWGRRGEGEEGGAPGLVGKTPR